jgi:protein-S-isoprenylcysteine O-methyltransferase Ste14
MTMKRDHVVSLLFALSALFIMLLSYFTRITLPVSKHLGISVGGGLYLLGIILFLWTVRYLREAFLGLIEPATNHFIKDGPYRWVRHPLYLSMIIILIGIGVALRSSWGMISIFLIFLPAVIYRARLEEKALYGKFGDAWINYLHQTKFIIPLVC